MPSKESLVTVTTSKRKSRRKHRSSEKLSQKPTDADDEQVALQHQGRPEPGGSEAEPDDKKSTHAATQKMTPPEVLPGDQGNQPPSGVSASVASKEEEQRKEEEQKKERGRKKSIKGLKMPDGTYVGLEDKNKYLKAMKKEYLKCDYVPFCILASLAAVVIGLIYLYSYRPDIFNSMIEKIRRFFGLSSGEESTTERLQQTTTPEGPDRHVTTPMEHRRAVDDNNGTAVASHGSATRFIGSTGVLHHVLRHYTTFICLCVYYL
ncbi:uncharacterized protein LOC135394806 [Ornithodoros turicata]|uniref:uncharacterized protein LOC135394806 n=1 Tax=Ornithodoros turicata TaxID=34597 RepID=UPI00313A0F46